MGVAATLPELTEWTLLASFGVNLSFNFLIIYHKFILSIIIHAIR